MIVKKTTADQRLSSNVNYDLRKIFLAILRKTDVCLSEFCELLKFATFCIPEEFSKHIEKNLEVANSFFNFEGD